MQNVKNYSLYPSKDLAQECTRHNTIIHHGGKLCKTNFALRIPVHDNA